MLRAADKSPGAPSMPLSPLVVVLLTIKSRICYGQDGYGEVSGERFSLKDSLTIPKCVCSHSHLDIDGDFINLAGREGCTNRARNGQ